MTLNPLIVIFYALCSYLLAEVAPLPVTSQPLASNPDHLAWEAWLTVDSRNPFSNDMTRKITPKSIFIAPNFRNESLPCPPGFKVDHRGQCIRIVSIDPNDLLANRLQSILASANLQTDDEDIYDYDDAYDTSGPYQVNLPVSLDANSKLEQSEEAKKTMEGLKENTQILKGESSTIQETVEERDETTTISEEETKIPTDMSLASTEDATEDITEMTTMETLATISTFENIDNTTDLSVINNSTNENENFTEIITESPSNQILSTTVKTFTEEESKSVESEEEDFGENSTLKADLERDSLVLDESSSTSVLEEMTTMANEPETTDVFTQSYTTSLAASQPTTITTTTTPRPTEEKRIVIITDKFKPSQKEAVQIVTPIPNIFIATSTTDDGDDYTTQYVGDLLGVVDESEDQKKIREMMIQEEQKNAAMEKIDANNRFVYHHLRNPTSTTKTVEVVSSTTTSSPLKTTITTTEKTFKPSVMQKNKTTQRPDNRIRFPTEDHDDDDEDPPDAFKADLIRFPGPSSHRFVPNMNRLIPESLSRKPPVQNDAPASRLVGGAAASNRKPAWYPPSWGRNSSSTTTKQQKPVLMRFWSRMPLIRDSTFTSGRRSLGHRENSKSPSEDLYKEVTTHDVYRVIGSRQKKHTN